MQEDSWADHPVREDIASHVERRVRWVAGITASAMIIELAAGYAFGSMALLADGVHMASHALALGISAFAYAYARAHAADRAFSFGTGKVNSLAGFAGALLLALFAAGMAWESLARLFRPVAIVFDSAILVAVFGLLVNVASVALLHPGEEHDRGHRHDHNWRAAYLHVLADALTSVLAIAALAGGRLLGWVWLDPVMGLAGAALVLNWSWGLIRATTAVLLDKEAQDLRAAVAAAIESGGGRVVELHCWAVGPGRHAVVAAVACGEARPAAYYRSLLPAGVAHAAIEVRAGQPDAREPVGPSDQR